MTVIRRQAFKAALAIEDKSIQQWADEHEVSYTHLQYVLSNKRLSRRMANKVDSYIAATLIPFCHAVLNATESRQAPAA